MGSNVYDSVIHYHFQGTRGALSEGEDLESAGLGESERDIEDGVAGQLRIAFHAS